MRAGTTYRIHRAQASGCTTLELFAPGTSDFESDSPVRRGGCGGYFLFTPAAGEGGRYSLVVTAQPRRRGDQRYHLQVAQAGEDDTSPGLALANYQRARGALQGNGVDVVDLYRFSLARRSLLRVRLRGSGFRVQLLRDTGARLGGSEDGEIQRRVSKGRYFIAVRAIRTAAGRYVLQRQARTITRTRISINGARSAARRTRPVGQHRRADPPAGGGAGARDDRALRPLRRLAVLPPRAARASGGSATVAFTPPSVGRWRARAEYLGTREAAPSETGYANLLVAAPI